MRSDIKYELNTGKCVGKSLLSSRSRSTWNIDNGIGIFAGYNYYTTPEL